MNRQPPCSRPCGPDIVCWRPSWRSTLLSWRLLSCGPPRWTRTLAEHLTHTLAWLYAHGIPRWFSYPLIEWLSNVAMFLPFGFLVSEMLERGAWWKATIAGLALSTAIEMIQFLFFAQRTASVLDVLANTLGALVGAAAFMVFAKIRHKHANVVNGVPGSLVGDSSIDPKKN